MLQDLRRSFRPQVGRRNVGLTGTRGDGVLLRAKVKHFGLGALLRFAHLRRQQTHELRDLAAWVVKIARHDGLHWTDDHAGRLQAALDAMRTVVAFLRRAEVRMDVDRVVRTGLHARLATDAAVAVQVHDAVGACKERLRGTDLHARRVVAVIASQHGEVPPRIGILTLLKILHPGPKTAHRHLVLLLAGYGASMAPAALALIEAEAVAHAEASTTPGDAYPQRHAAQP